MRLRRRTESVRMSAGHRVRFVLALALSAVAGCTARTSAPAADARTLGPFPLCAAGLEGAGIKWGSMRPLVAVDLAGEPEVLDFHLSTLQAVIMPRAAKRPAVFCAFEPIVPRKGERRGEAVAVVAAGRAPRIVWRETLQVRRSVERGWYYVNRLRLQRGAGRWLDITVSESWLPFPAGGPSRPDPPQRRWRFEGGGYVRVR